VSKLVCTAGPAHGQEFLLEGDELVVGRASDNAISIPDTSVSRRHVTVKQIAGGWAAVDLGSGNGTLINGAQISAETPLNDGDVITLGDTDLKFQAGVPVGGSRALAVRRSPREAEGTDELSKSARGTRRPVRTMSRNTSRRVDPEVQAKQRLLKIRIGIAVAALLLPLIGWKLKANLDAGKAAQAEAQRQKAVTELRVIQQDAKRLVREGKWAEAKAKFDDIVNIDPGFEAATVADYLARAEKEIPNQKLLNEARTAIAEGKITVAFNALEKVSGDTLQGEARGALKAELETVITKSLEQARLWMPANTDEEKMKKLLERSVDVLGARPDQRDALKLKDYAEEQIRLIIESRKPGAPPPDSSHMAVQNRYNDGDFNTAFSMAQACAGRNKRCVELQKQIKEFIGGYAKLESASAPDLIKLGELDRGISRGSSGGKSQMSKKIGVQLVGRLLPKAQSAKSNGEWGKATEYAKQVLLYDEDNVQARAIVSESNKSAMERFQLAYSVKDSDPESAIRGFRDVIGSTSPDNEWHKKAKMWLNKMGE
jgi:hypothetical protein